MARTTRNRRGDAPRRPEPTPEAPPSPAESPSLTTDLAAPRLDLDDLQALADMSADELAALLGGEPGEARFEDGQQVTGIVSRVERENVFVDVGAKQDAVIARAEVPEAQPGDALTAYVLHGPGGRLDLTRQLGGSGALEHLETAKASKIPVEGKVSARNPGGFTVLLGDVRAFCPVSAIDRRPGADLDAWVGQTLRFLVLEAGRDVVVSRRSLQEAELQEAREAFFRTAKVGERRRGTVSSVRDFGVFVDLDAAEGLIPGGSLGGQKLQPGEAVEVRITRLEPLRERVSLELVGDRTVASSSDAGGAGSLGTFGDLLRGLDLPKR